MRQLRETAATNHAGAAPGPGGFPAPGCLQGLGAMAASLGGVDVIALTGVGSAKHDTL